jgi:hypothetical protein
MKRYQSNSTLAHAFATYQSYEGKANNMFFRGATIYSYGEHFPIATRCDGVTFFNENGYSNTTAKHKSLVRSAINGDNIVECMYVPQGVEIERNWLDDVHKNNFNYWEWGIETLNKELQNPRIRNRATRLQEINRLAANRLAYKMYFNL